MKIHVNRKEERYSIENTSKTMKKGIKQCMILMITILIGLIIMSMQSSATESSTETTIVKSGTDGDLDWTIDSNGHLTVSGTGDLAYACTVIGEEDPYPGWYTNTGTIKTASFDVKGITNLKRFLYGCTALTEVDLSGLDTSNVTNMEYMFYDCRRLTEINLSGLDVSNVSNMNYMFYKCEKLTEVDLTGLNITNLVSMDKMFASCSALTKANLSGLDRRNVTNMQYMFMACFALTEVDFRGIDDATNAIDMYGMFQGCSALTKVDFSGDNPTGVSYMHSMFMSCKSLKEVNLSQFDTSELTNTGYMFYGCSSLTELDLSTFNTSNVQGMHYMFNGCSSLSELDLSTFDTSNVTSMNYMFYGCSSLTELDLSTFNTSNVKSINYMFSGCRLLTELDLSGFDLANLNKSSDQSRMLYDTELLVNLKTPKNLSSNIDFFESEAGSWMDKSGVIYTSLPKNMLESIELRCGGWSDEIESISGYSISLNGDVAVNFYMNLSDEVIADTTAYMQFTMPNGDVSKVMVSYAEVDSTSGNYIFPYDVSAAEMTDEIKAQIITTVGETEEYTYSVKTYADYILANTDVTEYAEAEPLVRAMLNYGGYSQKQFNHNTDNLANVDLYTTDTDPVLNDAVSIADTYAFTTPSNDIGLKYYGSSLLLNSKTTIRHYFTITGGESLTEIAEKYTFKLEDGTILTPKMKSGMICVDIEDINAPDLDEVFNLTVTNTATNGTIAFGYSPMTYAKYVLDYSLSGQNLVNVIKAMYWYNQAANAYFA